MQTFKRFELGQEEIPAAIGWYLADLGEARGKQELFRRQSPQTLKALREHAMIESAVSSNRIEGVVVDQARVRAVVLGKSHLRDRNEEEIRGYRDALKLIHESHDRMKVSNQTVRKLHRVARGGIGDAGRYKQKDSDIIERYPNGAVRVRFTPVSAVDTPRAMNELIELWTRCLDERWIHPLIGLAAFSLDFLSVHPFRDGNGRTSRPVLLLQCYHLGLKSAATSVSRGSSSRTKRGTTRRSRSGPKIGMKAATIHGLTSASSSSFSRKRTGNSRSALDS